MTSQPDSEEAIPVTLLFHEMRHHLMAVLTMGVGVFLLIALVGSWLTLTRGCVGTYVLDLSGSDIEGRVAVLLLGTKGIEAAVWTERFIRVEVKAPTYEAAEDAMEASQRSAQAALRSLFTDYEPALARARGDLAKAPTGVYTADGQLRRYPDWLEAQARVRLYQDKIAAQQGSLRMLEMEVARARAWFVEFVVAGILAGALGAFLTGLYFVRQTQIGRQSA